MKTKIFTRGTMVEIHMKNGDIFYCLLEVDFDLYKTFGNPNVDVEECVFFDEDWKVLERDDKRCEKLKEFVDTVVICEEESDECEYIPTY